VYVKFTREIGGYGVTRIEPLYHLSSLSNGQGASSPVVDIVHVQRREIALPFGRWRATIYPRSSWIDRQLGLHEPVHSRLADRVRPGSFYAITLSIQYTIDNFAPDDRGNPFAKDSRTVSP